MAYPSPRQLQLRRGNAAAVGSYTGLAGELTVNTNDWTLQVHDGSTVGGHAATVNTSTLTDQISSVNANITIANVGMKGYVDQGNTIQSQQIIAANLGLKGYIDLANTIQSAQITSANLGIIGYVNQGNTIQSAQISSANIGMRGYVDATIAANIANIAIASTYSNVNVRTYLGAFDGNIIPSANSVYSLGSITNQWKSLFVSNNTIYVGGVPLGIDTTGNLTINGTVIPTISYVNTVVANVVVDLSSYALNANVTAANVGILGYINLANTIQSQQISAANVGIIGYVDLANTIQSGQVGAANLAITTANTAMKGYVDSQTFYSNARVATYLQSGNIANISAAGNITATYFVGNGALLTGIVSGAGGGTNYSNVNVAAYLTTNSYLTSTTANLSTYAYASNVTTANTGVVGYVDLANTIQSNQLTAANTAWAANAALQQSLIGNLQASAYSNVNLASYLAGNVTVGTISLTGNVNANNLVGTSANTTITAGTFVSTFNNQGNVLMPNVVVTGNVTATYFLGNGALLTGIVASGSTYGNTQVAQYLQVGNIANVAVAGNVTATYFLGNGSQLTGISSSYSNVQTAAYLNTQGYNLYSNVNVAAYLGANPQPGTYSNANVASYLPTYSGNISANITHGSRYWTFGTDSKLTLPDRTTYISNGTLHNDGAVEMNSPAQVALHFNSGNVQANTALASEVWIYGTQDGAGIDIYNNAGVKSWSFTPTGKLTFAGTLTNGATFDGNDFIAAPNSFVEFAGYTGNTYVGLDNDSVFIQTNWNTAGKQWTFANTGTLTLPALSGQIGRDGYTNGMDLYNNNGGTGYVRMNYADESFVWADATGAHVQSAGTHTWDFGTTGNLKLPSGGYILNSDNSIYGAGSSYSNVQVATYLPTYSGNVANIRLGNSGVLTFADGTTQTTAGGGGSNYGNANVTAYTVSMGFTNFSNVNVSALITTNGLTNFSNVNVSALITTNGLTNFSNVNVKAYTETMGFQNYGNVNVAAVITTNGLTNYSNVNTAAYLNSQGYNLYSNANVASYLPTYSGNISNVRLGPSGNITFADGTAQTSAYSNVNLVANLRVSSVVVGNLTVLGALNTTLDIGNSFVSLATNNIGNTNDIGFYGQYNAGQGNVYTGLAYTATDGMYRLFSNLTPEPGTTINQANVRYSNIQVGNILAANVTVNTVIASNVYVNGGVSFSGIANVNMLNASGNLSVAGNTALYGNTTHGTVGAGSGAFHTFVGNITQVTSGGAVGINTTGNISASVANFGSGNVGGFAIGYRDVPQITAANVTLIASDAGKHYYGSNTNPITLTIPLNSSVAFGNGTAISIINQGTGNITIANIAGVQLYLAGNATGGSRTLTSYGMATLLKVQVNTWFINGTGVV